MTKEKVAFKPPKASVNVSALEAIKAEKKIETKLALLLDYLIAQEKEG